MSVEAMTAVLHHSRAKGTAKLVLLGIANHEGDGGAWPTVNTLARYAGCHVRNVQRALGQLQASGELRVLTQRGGLGGQADETRPNLYRVQVTCPSDCDGTAQHRTATTRRTHPMTLDLGLEDRVALAPPGGTDATGPGGAGVTTPVAGAPPKPSYEPSPEPTTPPDVRNAHAGSQPVDKPQPGVPCPPSVAASIRSRLVRPEGVDA